ncbi:sushi, nidogen and EGF-like domain-containing protein 1 [Saccoglossus kowalevskii]
MVAPFWADVNTRNGGNVYWRETTDPKIVARAIKDINTYTCDLLDVVWVFIATWDNTAFYGAESDASRELRNTFQAVLISDGEKSFAIYNYCDIEWTTGEASDGNTQGIGGTPAQVGFNAGDGVTFFAVPSSFKPEVIDIEETTNVGVPGRYVFQLNGENIIEACSCIEPNCVVVGCNRYEIHTTEIKWAKAKTKCEMDGGRLATLNTHHIYKTVRQYILTNALDEEVNKGFWIGLNDRDSEGNFVWSDGSTLEPGDFSRWAADQPNDNHQGDPINGQDCVQLWAERALKWDDDYCGDNPEGEKRKKGYICEIPC